MGECLNKSTAYGITVDGDLDQATIHSHARGAMVNWLHLHVAPIRQGHTDEDIRKLFLRVQEVLRQVTPRRDLELVCVDLKVSHLVNPATVDLRATTPAPNTAVN